MTVDPIIALPAVASAVAMRVNSLAGAFFQIYLPLLLLLPDDYYWGWPPLNFHQYAILPIGVGLCWWVIRGKWKKSFIDVGVFAFIGWTLLADIHATGSEDIVNRVLTPVTLALFPYMAGKLLIEQTGLRIKVARRFVFLLAVDVILSCYEFRFAVNPFRHVLDGFFTSFGTWFTQVRYGFGRTSGPFGHAIFMGAIVAIAILLHRYLAHFGFWERRFSFFSALPLNKPRILLGILIVGSLMTISRGPWIAVVVGLLLTAVGTSLDRKRAFRRTIIILVVSGTVLYLGGKAYLAGADRYASQEELASAVYRSQLLDEYKQIALQRKVWGWGTSDWPRVPGMVSVDNWYLLVALMYGVTGVVLFLLMLLIAVARLIWVGMFDNDLAQDNRTLLFSLASIIVTVAVAVGTVFLGAQLFPLLFLFLGWSDACLAYRPSRSPAAIESQFLFRRVIA